MKNVTINLLDYFWKKGIKPIKDRMEELKEVAFSGKYSDLSGTPNALKNPNALTFTGAVTDSYDGSNSKSVKIPSVTNNLLATQQGTALDAVQGKALDDKIGQINSNLTSKTDRIINGINFAESVSRAYQLEFNSTYLVTCFPVSNSNINANLLTIAIVQTGLENGKNGQVVLLFQTNGSGQEDKGAIFLSIETDAVLTINNGYRYMHYSITKL